MKTEMASINTDSMLSLEDIEAQSDKLKAMMDMIRDAMLAPIGTKATPTLTAAELGELCNLDSSQIAYRVRRGDLPVGSMVGKRREWPLDQAQTWCRTLRSDMMRPKDAHGVTMAITNFKGGVAKTTTAVTLAQGLSIRGHKVLLVDLDPQGSATTLFGVLPNTEVDSDQTALDIFSGDAAELNGAVRSTYWPNIDLVCASPLLFGAEFHLPARQSLDPGFEFWNALDVSLDSLRQEYDAIIIDTAPSLSYVTINALMAADGLIMPLPPSALDFSSSVQFWGLFSDLTNQLVRSRGANKYFHFIDVLLSRVDSSDAASNVVREWVFEGYGKKVLPIEIPKTSAAVTASAEFGTVYDMARGSVHRKTLSRAKDAYDRMCDLIEGQLIAVWKHQLSK